MNRCHLYGCFSGCQQEGKMTFDLLQGIEAAEGVGRGNEAARDARSSCLVHPRRPHASTADGPQTCAHDSRR